jgi:hypothetical protein
MMKTKRYFSFMVMIAVISFRFPAMANLSFYTDRSDWESDVNGDIVTEDFDSVTPSFLTGGVNNTGLIDIELINLALINKWNSIDDGSSYSNVNGTPYYQGGCRSDDPDTIIVLHMPFPVNAFGGDFTSTCSGDGLALQVNGVRYEFSGLMSSTDGTGFLGFISTDAFSDVTLFNCKEEDYFGETFGLDNVRFVAVPEPATMILLGLGGFVLRKRGKV